MYWIEKSWISIDLHCVVVMTDLGHRCGYVAVPHEHCLYGVGYNENTQKLSAYWELVQSQRVVTHKCLVENIGVIPLFCFTPDNKLEPSYNIGVHGGLTYSGGNDYPISTDGLWWFGYDCAHAGDGRDLSVVSDSIREIELKYASHRSKNTIRSLEYCVYECIKLANQLRQIDKEYRKRKEILFRKF